jgi:hypothetical protein
VRWRLNNSKSVLPPLLEQPRASGRVPRVNENYQFLTMFNVSGPCDDIAHAGQTAPLPMVVCSLVFPRDERGRHLIQQESSDKNEASGIHAESPSPRLPAIQTLHNRGVGAGPLHPGSSRPSTTGRRQPRAAESKKRGRGVWLVVNGPRPWSRPYGD